MKKCKYKGKYVNDTQFICNHPIIVKKEKFPIKSDETCETCKHLTEY